MTDGNTDRQGSDSGTGRATVVLGGGLAAVLLAAIGATGGWLLAGGDDVPAGTPVASASVTGEPTASTSAPRPSTGRTTPSAPRTSASARPTGLTVPPVVGTDFEDARDALRDRRLGWRLVFGTGAGRSVVRTSPEVGAEVARGTTVQLYVAGPAPAATVPDLVGDDCAEAADDLGEEGFYPRYRTGRSGKVSQQEPAADSAARWNDEISIWCGASASGSPSADPTP
ncbi:PASTA domain-containing protein [Micromonospora sp. GCM10011542]|uniref:PASTA domain-containing protein n=1 Tax=Micromonospora sp. GCM10011542 TaxID=3317337 RepID=UPI0036076F6D